MFKRLNVYFPNSIHTCIGLGTNKFVQEKPIMEKRGNFSLLFIFFALLRGRRTIKFDMRSVLQSDKNNCVTAY